MWIGCNQGRNYRSGYHHSRNHRCDHTPYEGFEVRGLPSAVVAGGEVRFRDGQLRAKAGSGRFLRRSL